MLVVWWSAGRGGGEVAAFLELARTRFYRPSHRRRRPRARTGAIFMMPTGVRPARRASQRRRGACPSLASVNKCYRVLSYARRAGVFPRGLAHDLGDEAATAHVHHLTDDPGADDPLSALPGTARSRCREASSTAAAASRSAKAGRLFLMPNACLMRRRRGAGAEGVIRGELRLR